MTWDSSLGLLFPNWVDSLSKSLDFERKWNDSGIRNNEISLSPNWNETEIYLFSRPSKNSIIISMEPIDEPPLPTLLSLSIESR
jgi:hypothetical protein